MADETPTSKKLLEKQQRRAAEEERRRAQQKAARKRNLVTLGIAVVVFGVVIALVMRESGGGDGSLAGAVATDEAGCGDVEEHEDEGQDHVEATPEYGTNPPTSGPHLQTPASGGFFDEPVDPGALVHNLEHGQIVFWYDPEAPEATIDAIEAVIDDDPASLIAVPWEDIESPYNFAMTAWTHSQHCEQVSTEVVDAFREEFQGRGPEPVGIKTYEAPEE
ncbi:MAG TPA: DUF3105 domain-containing protein [Actinomycetota bacterium]|nr:DUF3105 domain-containing protein [Actinomycetota bacterium]